MDRVLASTLIITATCAVTILAKDSTRRTFAETAVVSARDADFFAVSTPRVADIDGHVWTPLAPARGETNLVLFVSADCPVSARYAPELDRIAAAYAPRGVRAFLIYADLTATIPAVRQNVASFHPGAKIPAIIDAGFELTAAANATVTPEAFVYTSTGRAYRGRIDDLYVSIGKARQQAQHHDLRDALDAVLAGHAVATAETSPVGCYIERVKGRLP
jgi:thiol-disulfide isomerase/thioredoxin